MPKVVFGTRKIVTLLLTIAFCYMSMSGKIGTTEFMTVFTIIIGFYFGGSTALDDPLSKRKGRNENDKTTQL